MSEEYADILKKSWDEIQEMQTLPVGSYLLKLRNISLQPPKGDGDPRFMFVYEPKEALSDVDEDELAELGPDYDISENRIYATFWYSTSADLDKVRKHLAKHGVDVSGTLEDSFKAAKGAEVVAYLTHRVFTDNAGEPQTTNEAEGFKSVDE